MIRLRVLALATGFQWDAGNDTKNCTKHSVTSAECEELFFHQPLVVQVDAHSREARYAVLGQTAAGRRLFLVFTLRGSARTVDTDICPADEPARTAASMLSPCRRRRPRRRSSQCRRIGPRRPNGPFGTPLIPLDYLDWSQAQRVRIPALKPSTTTISLRLPDGMLDALKVLANERDVPYQSLLKVFLAERLAAERGRKRFARAEGSIACSSQPRGGRALRALDFLRTSHTVSNGKRTCVRQGPTTWST
ncbi:MAG: CopG family antitoxin [Gemmatimonadaceae bacterium]